MEDVGQIILVVVAVVGAIAQQIAKSKKAKEKREVNNTAPSHSAFAGSDEDESDDPFSWLTGGSTSSKPMIAPNPAEKASAYNPVSSVNNTDRAGSRQGDMYTEPRSVGHSSAIRSANDQGEYFSYDNAFSESMYNHGEDKSSSRYAGTDTAGLFGHNDPRSAEFYGGVEGRRSTVAPTPDITNVNTHSVAAAKTKTIGTEAAKRTKDHFSIAEPITTAIRHSDTNTDIAADFDLRRAVIYSEILKAKYQDY